MEEDLRAIRRCDGDPSNLAPSSNVGEHATEHESRENGCGYFGVPTISIVTGLPRRSKRYRAVFCVPPVRTIQGFVTAGKHGTNP